ncbi:hypothetical protein U9M48_007264 [Paspalum notatum var. saurae]|uniref:SKP1 component POZ domain-containing protein n=1 Tax=Paspalum notatum var. saurae TaxID=547442 RepID=A0AAQ3PTY7_PASNO
METKMLTLYSSDNHKFEVKESVAMQSVTLKNMIKESCADNGIQIPKVTSVILAKVIEYCNKHAEPNKSPEDELKIFDANFVDVDKATLCDLTMAANYLDIKGLRDLTLHTITDMVKGKGPKENREADKKQMEARFNAFLVHWKKTAKERLTVFAEQGERSRKRGYQPKQPPLEIIKYPVICDPMLVLLLAFGESMGMGYNTAVPSWRFLVPVLREYYNRNAPASSVHQIEAAADPNLNGDDENGLAALVNLCINLEGQLLYVLKNHAGEFDVDWISLNDKLSNCAHQITNMESGGFPCPTVTLKCIMAEADLLCELLTRKTGVRKCIVISCDIRKLAFRFMTYKGPEHFAAAAIVMATTKEAKSMVKLLRNKYKGDNGHFSNSCFIRKCTLGAMFRLYSIVEESTGGSTATKLVFDESSDKNYSENELINKANLLEKNEINQSTKDECYNKSGPEMGLVGDAPGELNEKKQKAKEDMVEGVNMNGRGEMQKAKVEILRKLCH